MNLELLKSDLRCDEGVRSKPYKDTVGKTTIGVGRNLDDVGISDTEIDLLLTNDVLRAISALDTALPWVSTLSEPRQRALTNMAFNMGIGGLLGFKNALAKLQTGDFIGAADEFLASRWAAQVGARATRLTELIRVG